jgi:hypothetical protein
MSGRAKAADGLAESPPKHAEAPRGARRFGPGAVAGQVTLKASFWPAM